MTNKEEIIKRELSKLNRTFNIVFRTIWNAAYLAGKKNGPDLSKKKLAMTADKNYMEGFLKAKSLYDIPDLKNEAYAKGLADFAAAARKAFAPVEKNGMHFWDRERVFGDDKNDFADILDAFSPEQFVGRVRRFEQGLPIEDEPEPKDLLQVGDEIRLTDSKRVFVVVRFNVENKTVNLIDKVGNMYVMDLMTLSYEKTGIHFALESLFGNMTEE